MNREIEIKIPLTQSEYELLFSKIHEPPFTKPEHLYKSDTYFSRYKTRQERDASNEPRVIRIRTEQNLDQSEPSKKSYFCLKRKTIENGIEFNSENETFIEDEKVLEQFFEVAGYTKYFQKNKDAFSTYNGDFHLELEKVNGMCYVEIEVTTSTLPAETVRQNLESFVKDLGLDSSKRDSRSWMEIIQSQG
ncbi:MAG: CYTH domain-containing protein [Treponema sp.]|nr:CYTH domain-containing protein [Treponema sp.]